VKSFLGTNFGKDTSRTFVASLGGLAVKAGEKYFAPKLVDGDLQVQDVTGFTLPMDTPVYRVPVTIDKLATGRFIVTPDNEPLFVLEKGRGDAPRIRGWAPGRSEEVTYIPPKGLLPVTFFAQVVSVLDLLGPGGSLSGAAGSFFGGAAGSMLPFMLMSRGGDRSAAMMAMMAAGSGAGGGLDQQQLLLMMLLGGKDGGDDSLLEMLLMLQSVGGSLPFGSAGGSSKAMRSDTGKKD
jgi:hypothetical protein